MIQRVQSIWLLLTGLILFLLVLLPVMTSHNNNVEFSVLVTGLYQRTNGVAVKLETFLPLLISTVVIALMSLFNIFNYKNRTLQKRMVIVSIVLIIGLSFWIFQYAQRIPGGIQDASYKAGVFLPPAAILFCILAIRGINKDEQLIRSADRLR